MGKLEIGNRRSKCIDQTAPIFGSSECCSSVTEIDTTRKEPESIQQDEIVDYDSDETFPICGSGCCSSATESEVIADQKGTEVRNGNEIIEDSNIKELLVVGAGPHAFSLLLRLLEPNADLLSDKARHKNGEFRSRMRPISHVQRHLKDLARGPSATLKPEKQKKKRCACVDDVPPLSLDDVRESVLVVDKNGNWLSGWKQNFGAIGIKKLRSLMNAHADPYDHRALEYYAEMEGRGDDLVTLPFLRKSSDFKGPYQVPSTSLFHDYHDLLATGYGIDDLVRKGTVTSINPVMLDGEDEPIFQVKIETGEGSSLRTITVETRRVVCAMGPIFHAKEAFWETSLRKELAGKHYPSDRILHPSEIVPYLMSRNKNEDPNDQHVRLLVVGGGITGAQLALLASKALWCQTVKLIQRSRSVKRHFDVENKWMGPRRGKYLDEFWSLDMQGRAQLLQEARGGGSIPPEILEDLHHEIKGLEVQEEIQISDVHWENDVFQVALDDGSDWEEYDMIWLATGAENHIDFYEALVDLRQTLPVDVVGGLPVLSKRLSWRCSADTYEPEWKKMARERFWCLGILAGLELGPDALNLVGGRHGAVRVAKEIRKDMKQSG